MLTPLRDVPLMSRWSEAVLDQLSALHATDSLADPRAGEVVLSLRQLSQEGAELAEGVENLESRVSARRVVYAIERRLAIWQQVHQVARETVTQVSLRDHNSSGLAKRIEAAEQHLARLSQPQAWREYLLLDQLLAIALQRSPSSSHERSELARKFLRRLERADSSREQEEFFAHQDWRQLADEMREWVREPVDYQVLLDDIERIESDGGEGQARELASHYELLRWSTNPRIEELGDLLNTHYRNANLRVAISGDLLNRLLPEQQTSAEGVNDRLMGGRVFGLSRVSTRLRLVLLPDRERWRLGLEAHGNVDSRTHTKRGPARFHNAARSRYFVRKMLLIDRHGIHTRDASADATSDTDLTRVETSLDGVPLVNLLARTIAKQLYNLQEKEARNEAEGLLIRRAEARLDQQVDQRLGTATSKFRREIWQPLQSLELQPEAVDMHTTEDSLIARYRLASDSQIGAFTPRPQTPANSVLSIQVHESLLNNMVASLKLGGREVELRDLFMEVATRLQRDNFHVPDDVPEDVVIELAKEDPISFRCEDSRIHLTLRIRKLVGSEGHCWSNFEVRGIYVPEIDGIRVGVRRDSYVRLKGIHCQLPMRDQIALRGIFARVLPQHPNVDLLANVLADDERLHDLGVSQFVIRDGWISVALGSGRPVKMNIADDSPNRARR